MYIPLTLFLFATLSPVGRKHAVPIARATSDTTQQRIHISTTSLRGRRRCRNRQTSLNLLVSVSVRRVPNSRRIRAP